LKTVAGNGHHRPQKLSQSQSQVSLELSLKTREGLKGMFAPGQAEVNAVRRAIDRPRVFDSVVVLLMAALLLGAYLAAYAYVIHPNIVVQPAGYIGQGIVLGAWLVVTGLLFVAYISGLRGGKPWDRALPDGYVGSLAGALIFGAAWIVDTAFWTPSLGPNALGLDVLFTPPRLCEIAAVTVMVSGPLRAAARRGETTASLVTLLSAALLLSVITFATQFIHPLIDPWAWQNYEFLHSAPDWLAKNVGVAAILAQALILAGAGLLLNSGFKLRPGSLTFVFTINGALVTITKLHWYFVPVAILTGIAADLFIAWTARRPGRPSASLCAVIGGAFSTAYMIEVYILGTVWTASLWSGAILAATMLCWMMGRLIRAGLPAAIVAPMMSISPNAPVETRNEIRWTRDPASTVRPQLVRAALDDLGTPEALGRSPLGQLPGISAGGSTAADLRSVLVDVISELAASQQPRDAEAGRLLLDYYVKRVGSHEVIMERLHLSRPTFYRRLQRGFALVAERIDEMSEFATKVPVTH
jgi:hypothetical protein